MKVTPLTQHNHLGFKLADDELLKRAYITGIIPNSPSAKISSSLKASRRKVCGAFLISINHHPVFSTADAYTALETIQNEGVCKTIDLTIAPKKKLLIKDVRKAANDYGLFAPTTKCDNTTVIAKEEEDPPFLDCQQLNAINLFNQTNVSKTDIKQQSYDIKSIQRNQKETIDNVIDKMKRKLAPPEDNIWKLPRHTWTPTH